MEEAQKWRDQGRSEAKVAAPLLINVAHCLVAFMSAGIVLFSTSQTQPVRYHQCLLVQVHLTLLVCRHRDVSWHGCPQHLS